MRLRKEDFYQIDQILELYLQGEIVDFVSFNLAEKLTIENDHAIFLRDIIRDLNEELSFFRVEMAKSGNFYPLNDEKFLIHRFLEDGGMEAYYMSKPLDANDLTFLHQKIDALTTGSVLLLEGQKELDEAIRSGFSGFENKLSGLNRSDLPELVRAEVLAAVIGLAINSNNLEAIISAIQDHFN